MRKALTRAAHVLAAAGMLGLARPALAQTLMPDTKPGHGIIVRTSGESMTWDTDSTSAGETRLVEMQVEVALLANPSTFSCTLAARHTGEALELRGFVPNKFIKDQALGIARKHCTVPVIDKLQVNGILEVRIPSGSTDELQHGAEALLAEEYGHATDFEVQVVAPGRLVVHGTCKSCEELVQVSKKLRSLNGCCSVEIHLTVKPLLRAGHMVTLVTADGSLTVAAPGGPDTPLPRMHVLANSATSVPAPVVAPQAPVLAITQPKPATIDATLIPLRKDPVPALASVNPEVPAPFIPAPRPDPLSAVAKIPDVPAALPPVASVKPEVTAPVIPAPTVEPLTAVVKKPDLPAPLPPVASVKPEVPVPVAPAPKVEPLPAVVKKPDQPASLPTIASVKSEVPAPVIPAPTVEPLPAVVKKPDLPAPLPPVASVKPEVPVPVAPAPKVEPFPAVVKKPDLPAPLPPVASVKPEVPAPVIPAPKVEPFPAVVKKPDLPAPLPPVASVKPEVPAPVIPAPKVEPLPAVVKKPDLPAPPLKTDVPPTFTMKSDVTPLPPAVQLPPVKPAPPVVAATITPSFTPVAASATTPGAPVVIAATLPPVAAPVGSSASALTNVPAYAKQPTNTGWQTASASVEHLPTPATVVKTPPPPGGWPAAHETHAPVQVAYATTGVVMFDDDALPEPAPVFAKDKAELLKQKVTAACGPKASSVRVETTADGVFHVHVKSVAPDKNEGLTNSILQLPEMASPNVRLEFVEPK